jgi:hypothetical protein
LGCRAGMLWDILSWNEWLLCCEERFVPKRGLSRQSRGESASVINPMARPRKIQNSKTGDTDSPLYLDENVRD